MKIIMIMMICVQKKISTASNQTLLNQDNHDDHVNLRSKKSMTIKNGCLNCDAVFPW